MLSDFRKIKDEISGEPDDRKGTVSFFLLKHDTNVAIPLDTEIFGFCPGHETDYGDTLLIHYNHQFAAFAVRGKYVTSFFEEDICPAGEFRCDKIIPFSGRISSDMIPGISDSEVKFMCDTEQRALTVARILNLEILRNEMTGTTYELGVTAVAPQETSISSRMNQDEERMTYEW